MAKASTATEAPAAPKAPAKKKKAAAPKVPKAAAARVAMQDDVPPFSYGLATPGEDIPDGARRVSCPDCGAKHDVVRNHDVIKGDVGAKGQGGTWTVADFKCVAGCGYHAPHFPVH